jgi:hypothetical protein
MPLVSAPSTTRLVPLTRLATGLARKTTGAATCSGVQLLATLPYRQRQVLVLRYFGAHPQASASHPRCHRH